MSDPDALNTNLLGVDNAAAIVGQDMVAGMAMESAIAGTITRTLTKKVQEEIIEEGGEMFVSRGGKKVAVGLGKAQGKIVTRGGKQVLQRTVMKKGITNIGKQSAKAAGKAAGKAASKAVGKILVSPKNMAKLAATVAKMQMKSILNAIRNTIALMMGKQVATASVKVGGGLAAKAAGAAAACVATGPMLVGCAVGAAMLVFDIFNLILTIADPHGVQVIFHKDFIEETAQSYKDGLEKGFADAGFPGFFDEEILFTPFNFVFQFNDETNEFEETPEWGPRYNQLVDEYLTQKGIKPGWRDVLAEEAQDLDYESIQNLADQDLGDLYDNEETKKKKILFFSISIIILLIIIFFFRKNNKSAKSK
jgi:hypothetical protein